MQRWKHAGRGPKCTLLVGLLLGVASLVLYQSAYAATLQQKGYPGSIALPRIPTGPALGCTPTLTSHYTWVNGFDPLSDVTFTVNDHPAGSTQALSNGSVLVLLSFGSGTVQVNGNAPVRTHVGWNVLVIKGHKTTSTGFPQVVGLRLKFQVPHDDARSCVTSPTTSTSFGPTGASGPTGITSTSLHPPKLPRFTTSTKFMPTTLAKAIESPLQISPNKVILESSLLAAVLAAVLSAGALGSIWAAGERAALAGAATAAGATATDAQDDESGSGTDGPAPSDPEPGPGPDAGASPPPSAPAPPAPPAGGTTPTGAPTAPRTTSAFVRRRPMTSGGGGA
jgi:hypothetical protein